jgi:hypothetical protein
MTDWLAGSLDDEDIEHDTNDDTDCDGGSVNDQQSALELFVQDLSLSNRNATR